MEFIRIEQELAAIEIKKERERRIEDYFASKGYRPIEPDAFLAYDDFLLENPRYDMTSTVKVMSGHGDLHVLRPDITLNILGKIFASWEGEAPLKIYYNSKIYKNVGAKGILQQDQVGVESLGDDPELADREIFEMAVQLLEDLHRPYVIEVGSSAYLGAYLKTLDLSRKDGDRLLFLIDSKNQDGLRDFMAARGLTGFLGEVLGLEGPMEEVLRRARGLYTNEKMEEALAYLSSLVDFFRGRGILNRVHLDLSMLADLDYYDGMIFKAYVEGLPGKIISGGRYDRLTEKFTDRVPAVGFMMDMDLAARLRYEEGK